MAQIVRKFPKDSSRVRYAWDKWLNGQKWKLRRGVDFAVDVGGFRAMCYVAARKRGLSATTLLHDTGESVVYVQAVTDKSRGK